MRGKTFAVALAFAILAEPSIAAEVPITCTLTKAMTVIHDPRIGPEGHMTQSNVFEVKNFTISDLTFITSMRQPCDRIAGDITAAHVDVTCTFPPDQNGQTTVGFKIDRQMGTITETFAMANKDGSTARNWNHGTCAKRQGF